MASRFSRKTYTLAPKEHKIPINGVSFVSPKACRRSPDLCIPLFFLDHFHFVLCEISIHLGISTLFIQIQIGT